MASTENKKKTILALNVGSTSIKSRVFVFWGDKEKEIFSWSKGGLDSPNGHRKTLDELKNGLIRRGMLAKIVAVGHRVVHGGPIKSGRLISAKEINVIRQCSQLAPLHNPFNLLGIQEAARWGQKIVQAAVFDTAFFSCLPEYAKTYAIPESLAKRYQLYRCGFHGISHSYALLEAARRLKKPARKLKAITIHLGGGASIAAIKNGKAVDTSMGFTPLEGLVMSTRSGDIDPGIIFYLLRQGFTPGKLENILVNESGIKGLANIKNMRTLVQRVRRENALVSSAPARYRAGRAFDIYVYRIRKYIGAYLAALGGCDAVLFTGAVGSGDSLTRNQVVKPLKRTILKGVPVMAIISNEEKMIAREVLKLIRRG